MQILENTDMVRIDYDGHALRFTDKELGETIQIVDKKAERFYLALQTAQERFGRDPAMSNTSWNSVLLGMKYDFVM